MQISVLEPHGRLQKTITISWERRQVLVEHLRLFEGMRDLVAVRDGVQRVFPLLQFARQQGIFQRRLRACAWLRRPPGLPRLKADPSRAPANLTIGPLPRSGDIRVSVRCHG